MSKSKKIQVTVSLPDEAYTLIRAAGCIYGLSPKAYLKMVATQCALEDLERLGRVIDAIGEDDAVEDEEEDEAADFEGCECLCEAECEKADDAEKNCECKCDKEEKPAKAKKAKKA